MCCCSRRWRRWAGSSRIATAQADATDPASAGAKGASPRFLSADKVKFRRAVVPGDLVELRADLLQRRAGVFRLQGQARVGGVIAAEAELLVGSVST